MANKILDEFGPDEWVTYVDMTRRLQERGVVSQRIDRTMRDMTDDTRLVRRERSDGTVEFRDDVYKHDEQLDPSGLADAAAGGFVAPVSQPVSQPAPQPSLSTVTQASYLDGR